MYSKANQMTDDLQFAALTARMVAVEVKLTALEQVLAAFPVELHNAFKEVLTKSE